ncbi:MAG: dihydroneopterin aldolase [Gammaproteobacteria bacterium]|nr:dihydroneopterin aldolase [Gammaproteobacteria bacterium]MDB3988249.1 dihydroneopterin aldolase [Pseudomonadales bacterium]MBT3898320.1 dihydroneopterin aldolase [Gammaproteobacteria bacterium]MBT7541319.1 dihydroneopterin aldolase [Gammaproteobacteria bacterium]MDC0894344.1 dihydroneopterin aldolase [Pseudomonadales bacterium]|tara:strand:+ start:2485 stop:2853 length:369 start_codon:yes stop_codon:yes gene_type:complete
MAKDIIFIEGLEIETIIGVYEHERDIKQKVVLDIEMTLPESDASSSDDLRHTVDYDAVSKLVTSYVIDTQYQLIESLAEQVASLVLGAFATDSLKLKLSKPGAVKNAKSVGLIILRSVDGNP